MAEEINQNEPAPEAPPQVPAQNSETHHKDTTMSDAPLDQAAVRPKLHNIFSGSMVPVLTIGICSHLCRLCKPPVPRQLGLVLQLKAPELPLPTQILV